MSKIIFTDQLHNTLIDILHESARANNIKLTSKKFIDMQANYYQGVFAVIETINSSDTSSIPPSIYLAILRGEVVKKREVPPEK